MSSYKQKKSQGSAGPDVCGPTAAGPMPVPYPMLDMAMGNEAMAQQVKRMNTDVKSSNANDAPGVRLKPSQTKVLVP